MSTHVRPPGPSPVYQSVPFCEYMSSSAASATSSHANPPSSSRTSSASSNQRLVDGINDAFKTAEEQTRALFSELRISCTQAVMEEHQRAERLRSQSLEYLRERNFAWAKMKALLAEKQQIQNENAPSSLQGLRRSRSLGPVPGQALKNRSARNSLPTIKQTRSMSPTLPSSSTLTTSFASAPPSTRSHDSFVSPSNSPSSSTLSLHSAASDIDDEIKKEDVSISLSASPSSPRSISPISHSEVDIEDALDGVGYIDPFGRLHPVVQPKFSKSQPTLSEEAKSLRPNVYYEGDWCWLRHPNGNTIRLFRLKRDGQSLNSEHMALIFKKVYRHYVCRMCILQRNALVEAKRDKFKVAVFGLDEKYEMQMHCVHHHVEPAFELAELPQSQMEQVRQGFARTERDEDFLEYIRAGGA
ncbi:hypothetical protein H0H92_007629 [Tricholoma furcatifolium]|nr:hypothetical protein H0H92_007629 [Tricholoma furcatifolium]